ncbi:MAG: ribosomal L7Ae/L30e/S12e/Gadd45 family protein [Clostridia bacterium]|nr:ribosomal L7Ae/L30e/S12e/Gadd45 family protein [Clostridia bacterium]
MPRSGRGLRNAERKAFGGAKGLNREAINVNKNTLGVIGLATRAGKTAPGANNTVEAVRKGKAKLVLLACDASENTKKLVSDKSRFYGAECIVCDAGTEELGRAMGKRGCAAVAITDSGFVTAFKKSVEATTANTERGM